MAEKESIFFYTSSHGKRCFPNIFVSQFTDSRRFFVSKNKVFAVGGRKMADGVVFEVSNRANQFAPLPQRIILNFGDNDIRDGGSLEDILAYFVELVDQLTAIPYCRVVLTSLVI